MTSIINDEPKHKISNEGATKDSVWHNDTFVGLNVQILIIIWINATYSTAAQTHATSLPVCLKESWVNISEEKPG